MRSNDVVFKGGRVVDPAQGLDGVCDIRVTDGKIVAVGKDLPVDDDVRVANARDFVFCPGFIDMHVHLREPGQEHKETIATGVAAAVAGGFVAVACMPNTDPINDHAGVTEEIIRKSLAAKLARVYPIGAVTTNSQGERLTEIRELRAAGCVAISDDGHPVRDALMMRRALEYVTMFDMPVINHCEDPSLKGSGVVHEGFRATALGLRGIPGVAESVMVERDISLSELTGGAVHVAHMSASESLRAVRVGKERGTKVTCEVTPHHFVLTDEDLEYDANFKMNPPLRAIKDRDAILAGLADGSIDAIATDHAPHHVYEKSVEFDRAPFGIVGLETAVSLALDRLVHRQVVSLSRFVELMSLNPSKILRVPGGTLTPGSAADMTVLAPEEHVEISADNFRSKARNTPFNGWKLRGAVAATFVDGQAVFTNDQISRARQLVEGP